MPVQLVQKLGYTIKLPIFEGPLDLLLHLIREHKLDIYDIPIVEVTDQYLHYLSLMEQLDLDIAGEFFVMAATLLEIKSRMLLPRPPQVDEDDEETDPRAELVQRLLEYERFKNAANQLRILEDGRSKVHWRMTDDLATYDAPVIPLNLGALDLLAALQRMLDETCGGQEEVTCLERQKITLRMKMSEVLRRLNEKPGGIGFKELFFGRPSRLEIIMTFLALLELLRLKKIRVRQARPFEDIAILPGDNDILQ